MKKFAWAGPLCLIVGCIVLSVGAVYWAHRVHEQERLYQASLVQKLEDLRGRWNEIQSRRFNVDIRSAGILEGDQQTNVLFSDSKAGNEELDREELQVRENFAVLEKTIRNSNGGLLPDWVKEHRTWRELVQALSKFG